MIQSTATATAVTSPPPDPPDIQMLRAQFEGSPSLQAEFETWERYLAYYKGMASGRVKVIGGKR